MLFPRLFPRSRRPGPPPDSQPAGARLLIMALTGENPSRAASSPAVGVTRCDILITLQK